MHFAGFAQKPQGQFLGTCAGRHGDLQTQCGCGPYAHWAGVPMHGTGKGRYGHVTWLRWENGQRIFEDDVEYGFRFRRHLLDSRFQVCTQMGWPDRAPVGGIVDGGRELILHVGCKKGIFHRDTIGERYTVMHPKILRHFHQTVLGSLPSLRQRRLGLPRTQEQSKRSTCKRANWLERTLSGKKRVAGTWTQCQVASEYRQ